MFRRTVGDRLRMSPMEPLVAGAAAKAFERHVQQLYRYQTWLDPRTLLDDLSVQLMLAGAAAKAVAWATWRERA